VGGDIGLSGKKKELNKSKVDAIIFSPPYAERGPRHHTPNYLSQDHSMDNIRKERAGVGSKHNITRLNYGKIDAIVFSPPFKTASEGSGLTKRIREGTAKMVDKQGVDHGLSSKGHGMAGSVSVSKENVDSLPYGEVDAIVFSPPYSEQKKGEKKKFLIGLEFPKQREANRVPSLLQRAELKP